MSFVPPIKPAVEYGCEALAIITKTNSKRLDIFQNHCQRFITGGTRSTLITTMEHQTDSWCHVYTDGSAEEAIRNAEAGVYSTDFTLSYVIGRYFDNFDDNIAVHFFGLRQNKIV
ncbi:hypothetical protein CEXT_678821 [Caerostris extrusa]|uniref:Uncharacterized protein n=1 Tax=Caerostris extrusa TaxID=172846 RepID=A0AAV4MR92_CAEEX|nr:hypothetical protein CEXT_678821 [Caerostris extrusa]